MMAAEERTAWQLAALADCLSPDSLTSPGAEWLQRVATEAAEILENAHEHDEMVDRVTGAADSLVPIYTHERWTVFVDLGAYQEDPSELGGDASDMQACAGLALYMIAERLLHALLDEHFDTEEVED